MHKSPKPRSIPLPPEVRERVQALLPFHGKHAFGVSPSTLGRALADWGIAPGSLSLIEAALAKIAKETTP